MNKKLDLTRLQDFGDAAQNIHLVFSDLSVELADKNPLVTDAMDISVKAKSLAAMVDNFILKARREGLTDEKKQSIVLSKRDKIPIKTT